MQKRMRLLLFFIILTFTQFLTAQLEMGVSHVGQFTVTESLYGNLTCVGLEGDTLVSYKYAFNDRQFSLSKASVFPNGESTAFLNVFSLDIPEAHGEVPVYLNVKSEFINGVYTAIFKFNDHLFIIFSRSYGMEYHDIDISSINLDYYDPGLIHIANDQLVYLSNVSYPDNQGLNIYKINLETHEITLLIQNEPSLTESIGFQSFGEYTIAYDYMSYNGNALLIRNGEIVNSITGIWGIGTIGYSFTQRFCNRYYFTMEHNCVFYSTSLIIWFENDSVNRYGLSSSWLEGFSPDLFSGICTLSDSTFLTHYVSENMGINEFRTYQIDVISPFNHLDESDVFPDLSPYGEPLTLVPSGEDYALAISRGENQAMNFNLVDFTDERIRTYPFVFDHSSDAYFGSIHHSQEVVYIYRHPNINIFRIQPVQGSSDPTIPAINKLAEIYPNPFKGQCHIKINSPAQPKVSVYNIKGQKVRELTPNQSSGSEKMIDWDGKNDQHQDMPSGIYFVRIQSENQTISQKILKLK